MSPPDSTSPARSSLAPKAKPDIYTVLLAISLAAVLFGCLCLYLEWSAYDRDTGAASAQGVGSLLDPARAEPLAAAAGSSPRTTPPGGRQTAHAV